MILYHGSFLEIAKPDLEVVKPNLQMCFRTEKALSLLHFERREVL